MHAGGGGHSLLASPPAPTRVVLAGADTSEQPETLVKKVQEYAQKASAMVKGAFNTLQESDVAQQARCPPHSSSAWAPTLATLLPAREPGGCPVLSPPSPGRRWLENNADLAKKQLARLKQQLAELWKPTPAA